MYLLVCIEGLELKCLAISSAVASCSKDITVVKNEILYDAYNCSRKGTRCVYGYGTYVLNIDYLLSLVYLLLNEKFH